MSIKQSAITASLRFRFTSTPIVSNLAVGIGLIHNDALPKTDGALFATLMAP